MKNVFDSTDALLFPSFHDMNLRDCKNYVGFSIALFNVMSFINF